MLTALYTPTGRKTIARGRDLTAVRLIVGTGGALTRLPEGEATLAATRGGTARDERLLPPADAAVALDRDYVLACCGALLHHFDREAVVALMRRSIGR
jgi:capsular polysaccharide biosynthesis protein